MTIKVTTNQETKTEQEVTPEFCFQKAAEALMYSPYRDGGVPSVAQEWRELGLAIRTLSLS